MALFELLGLHAAHAARPRCLMRSCCPALRLVHLPGQSALGKEQLASSPAPACPPPHPPPTHHHHRAPLPLLCLRPQGSHALYNEQLVYVAAFAVGADLVFGDRPKQITYSRMLWLPSIGAPRRGPHSGCPAGCGAGDCCECTWWRLWRAPAAWCALHSLMSLLPANVFGISINAWLFGCVYLTPPPPLQWTWTRPTAP